MPATSGGRLRDRTPDRDGGAVAKDSLAVVCWTTVSRASGFARVAVIAAVLGPTYVGNVFQATNGLPNLVYAALTGSLFSNLLVPPLVRHLDAGDRQAAERLARAFLSVTGTLFATVAMIIALAGPLVVRALSAAATDGAAASQQRIGSALLVMFMPQLLMYTVVGAAEAVMTTRGRFALAAAAPAVENLGTIGTLATTALVYGTGDRLTTPPTGALLLLGLGTTASVTLHAAVQWWGARRAGVTLLPGRGWREPEVSSILRRAAPSLGYSTLDIVPPLGAIVVANRVPGGVVAFQFAYNLYVLPRALGARPVAVALLPRLSRLYHARHPRPFRDELVRGAALAAFFAVPAGLAFAVLAAPIAAAVSLGQMATGQGPALLATSIAALGPGVIGSAALTLGTYACYSREDAATPLRAVLLRAAIAVVGMGLTVAVPADGRVLGVVGVSASVAELAGGAHLAVHLRRRLPPGGAPLLRPLLRTAAAALLMAAPSYLVAALLMAAPSRLPALPPGPGAPVALVAATATGATVFLLVHRWWRTPELTALTAGLRGLRRAGGDGAHRASADGADGTRVNGLGAAGAPGVTERREVAT